MADDDDRPDVSLIMAWACLAEAGGRFYYLSVARSGEIEKRELRCGPCRDAITMRRLSRIRDAFEGEKSPTWRDRRRDSYERELGRGQEKGNPVLVYRVSIETVKGFGLVLLRVIAMGAKGACGRGCGMKKGRNDEQGGAARGWKLENQALSPPLDLGWSRTESGLTGGDGGRASLTGRRLGDGFGTWWPGLTEFQPRKKESSVP